MLALRQFRRLLLIIGFLGTLNSAFALEDLFFESLNADDIVEQVSDIFRDHQGYLWAATSPQGLARFNGYTTRWYRCDENDPRSISNNSVFAVTEDHENDLWVATANGLNKLDRKTAGFERYHFDRNHPRSLADNYIVEIISASDETLWVLSSTSLHRYTPETNDFTRYDINKDLGYSVSFSHMVEAPDGDLWLVSSRSGLIQFETSSGEHTFHPIEGLLHESSIDSRITLDLDGKTLWVASDRTGLFRFSLDKNSSYHYPIDLNKDGIGIPGNGVRDIINLDANTLAIATDQSGVCILDKRSDRFHYIQKDKSHTHGLTTNRISRLYKDQEGILWLGSSRNGIFLSNKSHYRFEHYGTEGSVKLSGKTVSTVFEDSRGTVWIGTDGNGVDILDRSTDQIAHLNTSNSEISSDTIRSIAEDQNGDIWIATLRSGLNHFSIKTGKTTAVPYSDELKQYIPNHEIWSFTIDSKNRFWLCGAHQYILMDDSLSIQRVYDDDPTYRNHFARILNFENDEIFYVGTGEIHRFNEATQEFALFAKGAAFVDMVKADDGLYYVATQDNGLYIYDESGTVVKRITEKNGLNSNVLRSLEISNNHKLWIGTESGLCRIKIDDDLISYFYHHDGLHGNSFFLQSAAKLKDGTVVFGGMNGLSMTKPISVLRAPFKPHITVNNLRLANQPVKISPHVTSRENHSGVIKGIAFNWKSKMISLDFAAIGFTYPDKIKYAYKLNGFDQDWIYTDSSDRKATYTNLSPGNYELVVKAADLDGNWSPNERRIQIEILSPFWMKSWFYGVLIASSLGFVWVILYLRMDKHAEKEERLKQQIKERSQLINEITKAKEHAEKSDRLKSAFLANMSHEIRTPMNAIIGFSQLLSESEYSNEEKASFIEYITKGSESLLSLIEDILDFSMIEADQLKVQKKDFALLSLLDRIHNDFRVFPKSENVEFRFRTASIDSALAIHSDEQRMRQIIANLLSNAFKFTNQGYVELGMRKDVDGLTIYVKDTAGGMSKTELATIFSEFVKLDRHENAAIRGVGLGLAITKRLTTLLSCELEVFSTKGIGTEFQIIIPQSQLKQKIVQEHKKTETLQHYDWQDRSILIAEDEASNFEFLVSSLRQTGIQIEWAKNGRETIDRVSDTNNRYDLILLDIKMPIMGGYEALEAIKKIDQKTPIIAQTAYAMAEDKVKLQNSGFSDFLSKPILREDLLTLLAKYIGK
ncbi:MAG: two-component regulator propeller domain-containing protein [Opitutaceae bacterium]